MNSNSRSRRPLIGIASCGFMQDRQFLPETYLHAIENSGGIPLILPCTEDTALCKSYAALCQGFLFPGGEDISPHLFGEEPLPQNGSTDLATDSFQLQLAMEVLSLKKPFLGICRGMQILNAALGGSIYQDLSLLPAPAISHMQSSRLRSDPFHEIIFKKDSLLYTFYGKSKYVNSFHHQAVHRPGFGLITSAHARDAVIEAIELPSHPFTLGVQWHPECMYETDQKTRELFSHFIKASRIFFLTPAHTIPETSSAV